MSRIFEIVQAMSGQKNSITIPVPYIDFFADDQQPHALGAILNQLVFWSGKSDLNDGWFYKEHAELASEIHGVSSDQVHRLVKKVCRWLPGVVEIAQRKVNGTKKTHYRIDGDALIAKIFPDLLGSAESRNGKREVAEPIPQNRGTHSAESRNPNREVAEPILYTDHYTDPNLQIIKTLSSENSGESPDAQSNNNFLSLHPDAATYNATSRKWGTQKDVDCAAWLFEKIKSLYESIEAKSPKQPNWTDWANEVRLMREIDGHSHREICEKYVSVLADSFWRKNILSPSKLREKWDELTLRLVSPEKTTNAEIDNAEREAAYKRYFKLTLDNKSKSSVETAARKEADGASVKAMRADFAKTTWNKIWAECSQRLSGGKAA
ncbi:replication protein 15 [Sodalis sp. RH21]|uniref:replication protein 15 n=1 Tax=unclassified Sodalis (in: enterobacteria) TaxID=2636512 RepID=UPI0039B53FCA